MLMPYCEQSKRLKRLLMEAVTVVPLPDGDLTDTTFASDALRYWDTSTG